MEETHSVAVLVPKLDGQETVLIAETILDPTLNSLQDKTHYTGTDPLSYVIQKLSKIVENEKSKRCVLIGKRPPSNNPLSLGTQAACDLPAKNVVMPPPKKIREEVPEPTRKRPVCYQCGLCKVMCGSFESLNEHIKQHGDQTPTPLACSECPFTSKHHAELGAHIRSHREIKKALSQSKVRPQPTIHKPAAALQRLGEGSDRRGRNRTNRSGKVSPLAGSASVTEMGIRKWYTYEQYGMYRCLICSYTCGQKRMLKTHAWKHAGEVDCSYPIFEDENEPASLPDSTVAQTPHGSEAFVLSVENKICAPIHLPTQLLVCTSEQFSHQSSPNEPAVKAKEVLNASDTPSITAEIVLEEETVSDTEQETPNTDTLLSSAQKIISCSENTKGHVNVIVERLPSAEETVLQKPFMGSTDIDVEKKQISEESQLACKELVYHAEKNTVGLEEILIGWCNTDKQSDLILSEAANENIPPVRRRTNSESLRLHSLAAEALVTMPIRAAELSKPSCKSITEVGSIDPDTGQEPADADSTAHQKIASSVKNYSEDGVNSLNWIDPELVDLQRHKPVLSDVPVKMGISMSLLTVIEKLRERTDQNTTDEDILKELQDNAQCQTSSDVSLSSMDLVEFIPNAEHPYRCRLCHYSSSNKGYVKQHLRVHREREPYQCPICEHIAEGRKDLESHMINHCKTRMYQCKQCEESFYYKSHLRNHERDQHSLQNNLPILIEPPLACDENEKEKCASEVNSSSQKLYKCDVCDYTSISYIGVRNHRRIHNSDKPYRCCLCGYVCSHPPSLKSHMWKHASDQNYNYEQVNKAINDAISQSSRVQQESQSNMHDGAEETLESFFHTPETLLSLSDLGSQTPNETVAPGEDQKQGLLRNTLCNLENISTLQRPGMEYCLLLFCCCICGFESTSKELLMDHMKEHEGEMINIILSKDQNVSQSSN
ncbi:zinc finger protein 507 isoform X2 [Ambystoma mexicanum]|uniref:zinc finger protein 507 isoform X2 n=1 Tax=Ambystoma mexicanum TaxID=8296 RepID=UPI0037E745B6